MPRGRKSPVGTETVINGYVNVKLPNGTWAAKHRLVAEEALGRPLTAVEYIRFRDGDRTNLDPSNLEVKLVNKYSLTKRIDEIKRRIAALNDELEELSSFI